MCVCINQKAKKSAMQLQQLCSMSAKAIFQKGCSHEWTTCKSICANNKKVWCFVTNDWVGDRIQKWTHLVTFWTCEHFSLCGPFFPMWSIDCKKKMVKKLNDQFFFSHLVFLREAALEKSSIWLIAFFRITHSIPYWLQQMNEFQKIGLHTQLFVEWNISVIVVEISMRSSPL